jgi:hypothetical protein
VTLQHGGFGNGSASVAGAPAAAVPVPLVQQGAADPRVGGPVAVQVQPGATAWERFAEELITWLKTLASAAVYATLIVTFVC